MMKIPYCTRFLILAATLLLSLATLADILQGRVVGISDGDTVTLLDASNTQYKIRLQGIDAPGNTQAFGNKSKETLSTWLFNNPVTVEYNKKDKYGRTLGKILVDGIDANLEQIKAGISWHYKKFQNEQPDEDRKLYAQAEAKAREEKRGL